MCLFSFQKPKRDKPVKLSKEIEMLKGTVERKELSTSTEVESETRQESMIRKTLVKEMRQDTGQVPRFLTLCCLVMAIYP